MSYERIRLNWSTLIRPQNLEALQESDRHAQFVFQPLERGFGDTLGAALRCALLRAVPGTAVAALHASLAGMLPPSPWMDELCLNLRQLALDTLEPLTMIHIEVAAGTIVRAAALQRPGLRVVDPELVLCTAEQDLALELWFERGYGIRMASQELACDLPEGMRQVDAFYCPVKRADYSVERTRVEHLVDYDRLQLKVDTNGAMTPRQALDTAARTLHAMLGVFINFEELPEAKPVPKAQAETNEYLFTPIADLDLSVRAANCLRTAQIEWLGQLAQRTEKQLMSLRSFGRKSLVELQQILSEHKLFLGMTIPNWQEQLGEYQASRRAKS